MSAFFSSLISACRARRSSRFFSNRSTSFTTFDRRRAAAPPPRVIDQIKEWKSSDGKGFY